MSSWTAAALPLYSVLMSQPEDAFSMELTIQVSSGLIARVGRQSLSARFCMLHVPNSTRSDVSLDIVACDRLTQQWDVYQRPVCVADGLQIAALVARLGAPARMPDIREVQDTSDGWTHLRFRIEKNGEVMPFEFTVQCSGFEGAHAPELRKLLRTLAALAGYDGLDRSLVGEGHSVAVPHSQAAVVSPRYCIHCGFGPTVQSSDAERRLPHPSEMRCARESCGQLMPLPDATCVATSCGHMSPVGSGWCWACGAALVV